MQQTSDLLEEESQPELFDADAIKPAYRPDPDKVRARLETILAEVRIAQELPWGRTSLYSTIFPQLTLWLPKEEAAQLCFEFDTEINRLKAA